MRMLSVVLCLRVVCSGTGECANNLITIQFYFGNELLFLPRAHLNLHVSALDSLESESSITARLESKRRSRPDRGKSTMATYKGIRVVSKYIAVSPLAVRPR